MRLWMALGVPIVLWVAGVVAALFAEFELAAGVLGAAGLIALALAGAIAGQDRGRGAVAVIGKEEVGEHIEPTTGLGTRPLLELLWYKQVGRFERLNEPFALAVLDIRYARDREEPLDDEIAITLGKRLEAAARAEDQVVRLTAHRFAALLSNTDEEGGRRFLNRLRTLISARPQSASGGGSSIYLRALGGVAAWTPEMETLEQLLDKANHDIGRFALDLGRQLEEWRGEHEHAP